MRAFTRTLLLTSWFLAAISLQAQTSTDPSGHWDGTIHAPNLDVVIGIDLATNANGQFTGTFAQPAEGVKGLPLSEIAVKGPSIRLLLKPGGSGGGTFNGTISADGKTISGDFIMADGGYAVPFSLTRTGEANIAPAPKSRRSRRSWKAAGTASSTRADDRCACSSPWRINLTARRRARL